MTTNIKQTENILTGNRRDVLKLAAGAAAAGTIGGSFALNAYADNSKQEPDSKLQKHQAFVYTEVQISVPFDKAPWRQINKALWDQPGLVNKTWLAGLGNNSLGGLYTFDTIANAQKFVTGYFPDEARKFGAAHTTRIFDAQAVKAASIDINSAHFGAKSVKPGAFVYTEVQTSIPFDNIPWKKRNPSLKKQPGLLGKTWLSGLHTNTVGGLDAFDTIDNAKKFALEAFPDVAKKMNAAFYTRLFDGRVVETASIEMKSPFFV